LEDSHDNSPFIDISREAIDVGIAEYPVLISHRLYDQLVTCWHEKGPVVAAIEEDRLSVILTLVKLRKRGFGSSLRRIDFVVPKLPDILSLEVEFIFDKDGQKLLTLLPTEDCEIDERSTRQGSGGDFPTVTSRRSGLDSGPTRRVPPLEKSPTEKHTESKGTNSGCVLKEDGHGS